MDEIPRTASWKSAARAAAVAALLLVPFPAPAGAQTARDMLEDYWQQKVEYTIACTLDPAAGMLTGTERIVYTNESPDTLRRFYMHLYPEAYRHGDSKLYRDFFPGTWIFLLDLPEERRGWLELDSLSVDGENPEYAIEGTILEGTFPEPLPPGGVAVLEMAFTEKIRLRTGRAGYAGDHFDMAQWYPKMAVYDESGWHPDQFRIGEFYGEFGSFDVSITLPGEYVVAATGDPVSGDPGWSRNEPADRGAGGAGRGGGHPGGHSAGGGSGEGSSASEPPKTVRFIAEKVHDFAWSADPSFVVERKTRGSSEVTVFYRGWNRSWADSVMARTLRTLDYLEDMVGPYMWPRLSIVDSPTRGGMEYPMLVMNGSPDMGLIVHETAHMWFYGMLANNERDAAWLDEGPVQYLMFRYLEDHASGLPRRGRGHGARGGRSIEIEGDMWDRLAQSVIELHRSDFAEPVATPHHEFENSARTMIYTKSALFFRALRYRVGDAAFRRMLREYFDIWKFRHVDEEALRSVAEEVSGADLDDFFKQWIYSVKDCDYAIDRFDVEESGEGFTAEVRLRRKGEMIMPLDLVFRMEDGSEITERVDGFSRMEERTFPFDQRPRSLSIVPENEILDIFQLDNNSPRRRDLALEDPFGQSYPTDAYLFTVLPFGYYNDVDGGKAGLRVGGSYQGIYRDFLLQSAHGFESGEFDVLGRYRRPVGWLGRETTLQVEGFYREGRRGGAARIDKVQRSSYSDPMPKRWRIELVYHELFDDDYVYPGTYEEGPNPRVGAGLTLSPRADIFSSSLSIDFDRSTWGSDFDYERFSLEGTIEPTWRFPFPLEPRVRLWYGNVAGDPPLQERLNLAGAGVIAREDYFWLRSVGAFWEDYYANFHLPGNSNLRGYFDGDYQFKRTAAANIEIAFPFPLPAAARFLDRDIYLFYDVGTVMDDRPFEVLPPGLAATLPEDTFDGALQDFGVGLKLWRIKAEFPLYLSHPRLSGDEEKWEARWTVGLDMTF